GDAVRRDRQGGHELEAAGLGATGADGAEAFVAVGIVVGEAGAINGNKDEGKGITTQGRGLGVGLGDGVGGHARILEEVVGGVTSGKVLVVDGRERASQPGEGVVEMKHQPFGQPLVAERGVTDLGPGPGSKRLEVAAKPATAAEAGEAKSV